MRLWAEISASAFKNNLSLLKELVFPSRLMLVVKANAYGHGIEEIVDLATKNGVKDFGVTSVSEAERVTKAATSCNVFCFFEPEDDDEAGFLIDRSIAFNLFTYRCLEIVSKVSLRLGRKAKVHLKLNTGMNRLGMDLDEVETILNILGDKKNIEVEGLWTHFATAELPDSEFVNYQLDKFLEAAKKIKQVFPHVKLHAANTGGALYYPAARLDLVRIGIGSYGYYPSHSSPRALDLKPVLKLKSKIIAVRKLARGEGVSYGLRWKAPTERYVGIVAAGYADGISYSLSGKLKVRYKGREYYQVGSICMDQFAVDFEETVPELGDVVDIIYEDQNAEVIAQKAGTITYAVLTGLGSRVKRLITG
jgi:alanine racemase